MEKMAHITGKLVERICVLSSIYVWAGKKTVKDGQEKEPALGRGYSRGVGTVPGMAL